MTSSLAEFLLIFTTMIASVESIEPVFNLCKRWNHQSAYKNGHIYVDGGNQVFNVANQSLIDGYNTYIIVLDTAHDWDWKTDQGLYSSYQKPERTAYGNQVPVVQRGALYADSTSDNSVYLYGGSVSSFNTSFNGAPPLQSRNDTLLTFDTATFTWGVVTPRHILGFLGEVPNAGASVQAVDLGLAFYIGGQIDNGTSVNTRDMGSSSVALGGMIVIDLVNQTLSNYSTSSLGLPRTRGQAVYLPSLGLNGALLYTGGLFQGAQNSSEYRKEDMVSFETITIFDINLLIENATDVDPAWYQQNATGQIPPARVDFCISAVSAADNSSHQIWMYGGQDGEIVYDDVWLLILPSFTWMQIFQGTMPRAHHTCHVVAGHQWLTLGGIASEPGSPKFTNSCDFEFQGVGIYDFNILSWVSAFNATESPYQVPANVYNIIGGHEYGGATTSTPQHGFTDERLARVFAESRWTIPANSRDNAPTTNNSDASRKLRKPALVGIILGSIIGFSLLLGLGYFLIRSYIKNSSSGGHNRFRIGAMASRRRRTNTDTEDTSVNGKMPKSRSEANGHHDYQQTEKGSGNHYERARNEGSPSRDYLDG